MTVRRRGLALSPGLPVGDARPGGRIAEDAETAARNGTQHVLAVDHIERVLAIAEEGEVVVGEPAEELDGAGDRFRGNRGRRGGAQVGDDAEACAPHGAPVVHRCADIGEYGLDARLQRRALLVRRDAVGLDVHPRLAQAVVGGDPQKSPVGVAADREDRMQQQVDGEVRVGDRRGDRVDEEG